MKPLEQQARDIQQVLKVTGLEPDELAARVLIKPDSMRKILKGYQRASDRLMELIRSIGREGRETARSVRMREEPDTEYSPLQKQLAFIERNSRPDERSALGAFLGAYYKAKLGELKSGVQKREDGNGANPGLAIVVTDPAGKIIEANEAFTQICGYSFARLKGEKPGAVLQKNLSRTDRATVRRFRRAIHDRRPFECTLTNYHANGSPYRVHIKMHPVFDELGQLVKFRALAKKL